jgi:D-hydroxyproline dehydrogenase subunit beta
MKYDLAIIGAGILGMAHAYHAAQAGQKVIVLEKDTIPQGSSIQNFGQIVPSGLGSNWFEFGQKSVEIYQKIQEKYDLTVRQNGTVYIASNHDEEQLANELYQYYTNIGYPAELLSRRECFFKYPMINAQYSKAGLYFPTELSVEPNQLIYRLIRYYKDQLKGEIQTSTTALACNSKADHVEISTSKNQIIKAKKVLICCGYTFNILYPNLLANSGLVVCKLQMLQTIPQKFIKMSGNILTGLSIRRYEAFAEMPSYQKMSTPWRYSELQKWGIHILFKQALDGSIIIGDSHEYATVADSHNLGFQINETINDLIIAEARRISDISQLKIARKWYGTYSQHPSDIFINDPTPNIRICTGIGGKGMTSSLGFALQHLTTWL